MPGKKRRISRELQEIEQKEETIEEMEEHIEELQEKSAETLEKIKEGEKRIEEAIVSLGKFAVDKSHLLETARALAGAALGVSVGMGLRIIPEVAENLPWANIAGILMFILFVSIVLVYRTEHVTGRRHVAAKILEVLAISVFVEIVTLSLFNILPADMESLLKVLVVGLFPTMSGAITFRAMT